MTQSFAQHVPKDARSQPNWLNWFEFDGRISGVREHGRQFNSWCLVILSKIRENIRPNQEYFGNKIALFVAASEGTILNQLGKQ